MTLHPNLFPVADVEDFAKHLGLDGTDADMFYEAYYSLNIEDEDWEETEYRNDDKYAYYGE